MISENKRTQQDYSLGFKPAFVDQVEKGEMTYQQALKHRCFKHALIYHSDRGCQYCAAEYQVLHER